MTVVGRDSVGDLRCAWFSDDGLESAWAYHECLVSDLAVQFVDAK